MKVRTKLDELIEEYSIVKSYMQALDEDDQNKKYLAFILQNARFAIDELDHDKICEALEALQTIQIATT